VIDEFTRLALACRVDSSIGSHDVIDELKSMIETNGNPKIVRCDNEREFIAATLKSWLAERRVAVVYIQKGQPQQNCFVERLNKEALRRCDVVGIFPSRNSLLRLARALLDEQNDEWAVGRRYFSNEPTSTLYEASQEEVVQPRLELQSA